MPSHFLASTSQKLTLNYHTSTSYYSYYYCCCCSLSISYILIIFRMIMADSSASYIRMVQHLIEKCLLFHMNKEECMEALSKHANIKPVITSTVWKELEKENREFFDAYTRDREQRASEMETMQRVQKMLADAAAAKSTNDDDDD